MPVAHGSIGIPTRSTWHDSVGVILDAEPIVLTGTPGLSVHEVTKRSRDRVRCMIMLIRTLVSFDVVARRIHLALRPCPRLQSPVVVDSCTVPCATKAPGAYDCGKRRVGSLEPTKLSSENWQVATAQEVALLKVATRYLSCISIWLSNAVWGYLSSYSK